MIDLVLIFEESVAVEAGSISINYKILSSFHEEY